MPTLDQAARQLGISEKTLRRWIKLLNQKRPRQQIVPTRHEWDGRYFVIREEDVDAIRDARAQMPGNTPVIPSSSPLAFGRRQSVDGRYSDTSPAQSATPRQRQKRTQAPRARIETKELPSLPVGMMGRTMAGDDAHGIPAATVNLWVRQGLLECDPGSYGNPARPTVRPLTRRGLHQLWEKAHTRADWRDCADCPHAS